MAAHGVRCTVLVWSVFDDRKRKERELYILFFSRFLLCDRIRGTYTVEEEMLQFEFFDFST